MIQPLERIRAPYRDWVRVWLAGLAFFYPAFWLANFIAFALPAMVRIVLFHERLEDFVISPSGAFAASSPPSLQSGIRPPYEVAWSLGIDAALVLATLAILAVGGRRHRTLSGLMVAALADVFLIRSMAGVFFHRGPWSETLPGLLGCVVFFGVVCLGLRWMLDAWVRRGFWKRVGSALAGFVLPATVAFVGSRSFSLSFFRPIILLLVAPGVLAALPAALWSPSRDELESGTPIGQAAGWKTVATGMVMTAILAAGIGPASRAVNDSYRQARALEARAVLAAIPDVPAGAPYPKVFFQRGVNFTAEWPNRYDSEGARQMLRLLPPYGINSIALVPYGWTSPKPPRVRIGGGPESWESDEGVVVLARLAHSLGMKVMLKPAIWESFNLEIPSATDRADWFASYALFLDHYARLAKQIHADLFFVGGEFTHLSRYDADWRRLIARARQSYPGPVVYGANFGEEFETITFWDALDYIGLQEYYPLPDDLSAAGVVAKVEAVRAKFSKPVIFTEAGFPAQAAPNRQPWEESRNAKPAPEDQARCYEAILGAFYRRPWFQGVYWWKVGTDGGGGPQDGSLTPWGKPAMNVVKRWYVGGKR